MTHSFPTRRSSDLRIEQVEKFAALHPSGVVAIGLFLPHQAVACHLHPAQRCGLAGPAQARVEKGGPVEAMDRIQRRHDLVEIIRQLAPVAIGLAEERSGEIVERSEEHTSELQSLMRTSYAVFCLKKKIRKIARKEHARR